MIMFMMPPIKCFFPVLAFRTVVTVPEPQCQKQRIVCYVRLISDPTGTTVYEYMLHGPLFLCSVVPLWRKTSTGVFEVSLCCSSYSTAATLQQELQHKDYDLDNKQHKQLHLLVLTMPNAIANVPYNPQLKKECAPQRQPIERTSADADVAADKH